MRSIFIFFLIVSTTAAVRCYEGSPTPVNGYVNYKITNCTEDVQYCNIEISHLQNERKTYTCGEASVCEQEGCRKVSDNVTVCCCEGDLCNKKSDPMSPRHQMDEVIRGKLSKKDMCMVGSAPVQGFNTKKPVGVNMRKRRCSTMCMRTVQEGSYYQKRFRLSCASHKDDCKDKPICQNTLTGLLPIDCCCKGNACNGLPWAKVAKDDLLHVDSLESSSENNREIPSHPRVIVHGDAEDDDEEDDIQLSGGLPHFKLFFAKITKPEKFWSTIASLLQYIVSMIESAIKAVSGN